MTRVNPAAGPVQPAHLTTESGACLTISIVDTDALAWKVATDLSTSYGDVLDIHDVSVEVDGSVYVRVDLTVEVDPEAVER
jgi:hypothetical protein